MADPILRGAAAFVVLSLGCAALLAATDTLTRSRIEANRSARFDRTVAALAGRPGAVERLTWDNGRAPLCNGRVLLRGSAAGYGGPIRWLAAAAVEAAAGDASASGAAASGSTDRSANITPANPPPILTGVRVTSHRETPGIADFVDHPDQGWLAGLVGRDAAALAAVDTVTGATITSRALRRALSRAVADAAVGLPPCPFAEPAKQPGEPL